MTLPRGDAEAVRARVRVWLLIALMAGVAMAAMLVHQQASAPMWRAQPAVWLMLPLFALAEVFVVHVATLRSGHSHSFREVPAVVGLAFLASGNYCLAYVVGAGLALLATRTQRGAKLVFNIAMFAMQASVGALVYRWVLGNAGPADLGGWLAAFAAVLVTDVLSAAAVTAAICMTERRFDTDLIKDMATTGLAAAVINTCIALLVVVLVEESPSALPLLGGVIVVLGYVYRGYVSLGTGYSRLRMLYRFVGSDRRAAGVDEVVTRLLGDACDLLRAEGAQLIVLPVDAESGSRTSFRIDAEVQHSTYLAPDGSRDAWWASAALGEPVLRPSGAVSARSPGRRRGDRQPGMAQGNDSTRDGMAAPLRTDGRVEAVMLVTNRTFEADTFSAEDLRLFETLAAHASVILGNARLVDHLRRLAEQREHEAHHDPLTELPNRRAFRAAVSAAAAGGGSAAVMLLDLDDFKDVNDTLGHRAGDVLLREVGRRLRSTVDGVVARLGGDEFAVLLPGVTELEAYETATRVLACIAQPAQLEEVTLLVSASIGVAMLPYHGPDADELLQHADVAMYNAKTARSGVEIYKSEDVRAVHRRLALAGDLPLAVREHGFEMAYQPQADAITGRIIAVEALLRWTHGTYGPIPPPEVVALAERTGSLRQLTDAVLEDALHQRAAWLALGHELTISVNVTARDLSDATLPDVFARLLASTGTPPAALTVEITESGVMSDPARCLAVLDELAAMQVRLAVDDFGTGYSSLAYLERLPVNEVKIDKSFVQRLERTAADSTVVKATIALAHDLGMRVVAEGVESEAGWARLADLGCEVVQGYWIGRPMPGEQIATWLQNASSSVGHKRAPFAR